MDNNSGKSVLDMIRQQEKDYKRQREREKFMYNGWHFSTGQAQEQFDKMKREMLRGSRFSAVFFDEVANYEYKPEQKNQLFKRLNGKQNTMNFVTQMMKKLLDSDTQTLVKAGYLDRNLKMTDKCLATLEAMLFDSNKAALVAAATAEIADSAAK